MEGTRKADKCSFFENTFGNVANFYYSCEELADDIRQKSIRSFSVDEILRLPTAKMDDRLAIVRSYKKYFESVGQLQRVP